MHSRKIEKSPMNTFIDRIEYEIIATRETMQSEQALALDPDTQGLLIMLKAELHAVKRHCQIRGWDGQLRPVLPKPKPVPKLQTAKHQMAFYDPFNHSADDLAVKLNWCCHDVLPTHVNEDEAVLMQDPMIVCVHAITTDDDIFFHEAQKNASGNLNTHL
ncbi:hypothetical protein FQN52_007114 [Onygenales sp. PD_12]|nr:hypothetical protein FQN52_007114 [Onygenales sp. PD_12]